MATSDPLDILLNHDQWATKQILLTCEKLNPEQFDKTFEMGPGSLRATTTHIISAMMTWTDSLAKRPARPRPDQSNVPHAAADLIKMLNDVATEFAGIARAHPLEEFVTRERNGKVFNFTRGSVITHVATHSMHHRAQCLNMLRHVGVSPLPQVSVIEWVRLSDNPQ
jgi:uncharacterized damage-inducible protein DinB